MSSFATILAVPELSRLLTGYLEPDVLLCKQVQLSKPSLEQRAQALRGSLRRSRMQNRKLEDELQERNKLPSLDSEAVETYTI